MANRDKNSRNQLKDYGHSYVESKRRDQDDFEYRNKRNKRKRQRERFEE